MVEPVHDIATARKEALAELRAIKEMRGSDGQAALLKDSEYLAAAWRVVELNLGLVHLTLRLHWYGVSYADAAMFLTAELFNACWNYEDSIGTFSTYAMACMRGKLLIFTAGQRAEARAANTPRALTHRELRERAARVTARIEKAIKEERTINFESDVHRVLMAEYALDALPAEHSRWAGTPGEQYRVESDPLGAVAAEPAEDSVVAHETTEIIRLALSTLRGQERKVLELRFGFGGQAPLTLQEIAVIMGLSRERIRQIERKALGRLRGYPAIREVSDPRDIRNRERKDRERWAKWKGYSKRKLSKRRSK